MEDYRQIILNAEPGQIIPIVKQIDMDEPVDFFARLSDYGWAKNCCLFESREYLAGSSALSFGKAKPLFTFRTLLKRSNALQIG